MAAAAAAVAAAAAAVALCCGVAAAGCGSRKSGNFSKIQQHYDDLFRMENRQTGLSIVRLAMPRGCLLAGLSIRKLD